MEETRSFNREVIEKRKKANAALLHEVGNDKSPLRSERSFHDSTHDPRSRFTNSISNDVENTLQPEILPSGQMGQTVLSMSRCRDIDFRALPPSPDLTMATDHRAYREWIGKSRALLYAPF